jgi:hypothetical protein
MFLSALKFLTFLSEKLNGSIQQTESFYYSPEGEPVRGTEDITAAE